MSLLDFGDESVETDARMEDQAVVLQTKHSNVARTQLTHHYRCSVFSSSNLPCNCGLQYVQEAPSLMQQVQADHVEEDVNDNQSRISFTFNSWRDEDEDVAMEESSSVGTISGLDYLDDNSEARRRTRRQRQTSRRRNFRESHTEQLRGDSSAYRERRVKPIQQHWTKECQHCGCSYLSSVLKSEMSRCCQNGVLRHESHGFDLKPLPSDFITMIRSDVPHFSRASSMYNNMFSMAATGVQNNKGGGYQSNFKGDYCVQIQGRTYHTLPKAHSRNDPSGGVSYFTFDSQEALVNHVDYLNGPRNNQHTTTEGHIAQGVVRDNVRFPVAQQIKETLLEHNVYARSLRVLGNRMKEQADDLEVLDFVDNLELDIIGEPLNIEHIEPEDHGPYTMHLFAPESESPNNIPVQFIPTIQEAMDYFDVAQITNERVNGERILTVQYKTGTRRLLSTESELMEVLTYPLLFINGGEGWGAKYRDQISFFKYLASRLLMPDLTDENDPTSYLLFPSKQDPNVHLRVNRFQLLSRVGQVFFVDNMSRAEDRKLRFLKNNQKIIFSGKQRKRDDALVSDDESEGSDNDDAEARGSTSALRTSNDYWIPSSFFGSKRHLRTKALNALRVVSEYGKATFFLTLTCNQMWPEIQSQLLEGQSAFDRPDVVNRVFHHRLQAFLHNLKRKHYIPHGIVFLMYCIEFQHRGLPHAHIVFRVENHADDCNDEDKAEFINKYVSAEMPVRDTSAQPDQDHNMYCELVSKHMVHKCAVAVNGCKKTEDGPCKRGYSDNAAPVEQTHIDEKGYPVYRRRTNQDKRVVPHNQKILMAWQGHANIEYAASAKCVLYLYNYLYKGIKPVNIRLKQSGPDETEEQLYLKGRFISSTSAIYRILGFNTYPSSFPRVKVVKVKDEDAIDYLIKNGQWTYLLVYWNRPNTPEMLGYRFTDLFKSYEVYPYLPKRFENRPELQSIDYFIINLLLQKVNKRLYLCKRVDKNVICRLEKLYPSAGDIFYLQMILAQCCPTSFTDARTVNGLTYKLYEQAALARGIVEDADAVRQLFIELQMCNSPSDCRGIFSTLLLDGFPMRVVLDDPELKQLLIADYLDEHEGNLNQATNAFLNDLKIRIQRAGGKRLKSYGFDEPTDQRTELQREQIKYNATQYHQKLQNLLLTQPNNSKQQQIYNEITESIDAILAHKQWVENPSFGQPGEPEFLIAEETLTNPILEFYFLSGAAGTGKTALNQKLLYYTRSRKGLCMGCASTTLAAQLYPDEGFLTAHSLFKYPVEDIEYEDDDSKPLECNFTGQAGQERWELLQYCHVIFWDEFVTNDRLLFESVLKNYRMKRISCVFICSGDFRQILPVVKNGTPEDIVASTISACPDWKYFKRRYLTTNMRLTALQANLPITATEAELLHVQKQTRYNDAILALAEAKDSDDCVTIKRQETSVFIETTVALKGFEYFTTNQEESHDGIDDTVAPIQWLYPTGFDQVAVATCSILAATNKSVDKWNSIIQQMNPHVQHELKSHDVLCQVDDPHEHLKHTIPDHVLNHIKIPNVPEHTLFLKVNDICLILRHMTSIGPHVATNTRVRIIHITPHLITAVTLTDGTTPGTLIRIPRIRFKFPINYTDSYSLLRTQFPLRLAYSMTYNKSQGQTLTKVLLDTTEEPFTHGHAYVSLSRIRSSDKIKIFCKKEDVQELDSIPTVTIKNIVYKEALKYISGPFPI